MSKKKETIVINIIGGPGVGKSILTSDVFSALKREGVSCEISAEYIKKKLREKALKAVESQIYIFAKQQYQLFTLKDEVDVIVTDSPIFFSTVYDKTKCPMLKALIMKEFHKYKTLNYLIARDETVPYEQEGRYQDAEGAKKVDTQMIKFLDEEKIEYKQMFGIGPKTLKVIVADVLTKLKENESKEA
jgi:nicotinamide riboside kinase